MEICSKNIKAGCFRELWFEEEMNRKKGIRLWEAFRRFLSTNKL
jgi:hypothetical protein